jgi:uncharacterized protein
MGMVDLLQRFLHETVWLFGQMAPYITLGFVFAGILHAFVPRRVVTRQLGRESVGAAIKASLLGVPLPLCSCGVVPTGIGLRKRGASRAAVVSFLISTPQTGLDSIFATYAFFGWVFAIFRPVAAFVSGIVGGVATLLLKPNAADDALWEKYHVRAEDALEEQSATPHAFLGRLYSGLRYAFVDLLGDIALWLVIGLLLAAVISMAIPDDFFADTLPGGLVQMLVMMAIGIPLYVCSTASIPIAAVLMSKGISMGAAFVFLMTGPATNAATMLIIGRVLGWRVLAMYLGSIAVLALGFGLGLDLFWSGSAPAMMEHMMHHQHELPAFWVWSTGLLLGLFVLRHFVSVWQLKLSGRRIMADAGKGQDLIVEGMNCSHCVRTVTESLKRVPGVEAVAVTLENGRAHVEGEHLDPAALKKAVEGVGYKVKS